MYITEKIFPIFIKIFLINPSIFFQYIMKYVSIDYLMFIIVIN